MNHMEKVKFEGRVVSMVESMAGELFMKRRVK